MADFRFDTVVIGAGQAGLAAAYYLRQRGVSFVVLDERAAVGDVWASRFDALRLFSPQWVSGLPGRPWPGSALHYPSKDEAAAYLRDYAAHFQLPVQLGQRVTLLAASEGGYLVQTASGNTYQTRRAVVATGAFNAPRRPAFAGQLPATVRQMHSSEYQRPAQVPGHGPVAVVGSGNSALQIAADLASAGRPVYAAFDEQTPALPNNQAMWAVLTATGMLRLSRHTPLGRRLMLRPEAVVSSDLQRLRSFANVHFMGRATGADAAGSLLGRLRNTPPLEAVVWATGFGPDFGWIQLPILEASGLPRHHRGLTDAPGVAFLGLPWLNTRRSALMGGAGPDARYVVEKLLERP